MILQVGNKLGKKGKSQSFMESLNIKLVEEGYDCLAISDRKNYILRMMDMIYHVIKFRRKTDLIIIHSFSTLAFWYAFTIASISYSLRIPYILVMHGGDFPNRLARSPNSSRRIFKRAGLIISPSQYIQSEIRNFGFEVRYIPNFIDIKNYPFLIRTNDTLNLLWVRAFNKIYNPQLFVELVFKLKSQGLSVHSAMVGPDSDGELSIVRKKIMDLKVEDNIVITGKMEKIEWIKLSHDYHYFINTTNYDNRPISVLEAMALGLPVLSTNVGGLPTLIKNGENGILVNAGDLESFVSEILNLMTDKHKYENIARNARKYVEQFDWGLLKNEWFDLIACYKRQGGFKGKTI